MIDFICMANLFGDLAAPPTLGSLAGGMGIMTAGIIPKLLDGWSAQVLTLTVGPFRLPFPVGFVQLIRVVVV